MTTKTTAHLHLSRRDRLALAWNVYERTVRDALLGAAFVVALLLVHSLLQPTPVTAIQPAVERRPIMMIATAQPPPPPAPTATPWPTPEPIIIMQQVEVPVTQPVYVPVPALAAPTPAPVEYQTASQPQAAPPEAPAQAQGPGGSGMMVAPDVGPIPVAGGDAAARWCAAAASAGKVQCVSEVQP